MVILPDGRPFVLGGTLKYDPFLGETKTAIFDPLSETFVASPDMGANEGRWYPSGIVLGNGSVLVYSGFKNTLGTTGDSVTNFDVQIWDGTTCRPPVQPSPVSNFTLASTCCRPGKSSSPGPIKIPRCTTQPRRRSPSSQRPFSQATEIMARRCFCL